MGAKKEELQQKIVLNDDLVITIHGYKQVPIKQFIYYVLCIVSLGTFFLLLHWFPKLKLRILGKNVPVKDAPELYIDNSWGSNTEHVKVKTTPFKGKISDIFPNYKRSYGKKGGTSPSYQDQDQDDAIISVDQDDSDSYEQANQVHDFPMKYFEYRYIRFIFNPLTSQYEQIIDWQDPEWRSVATIIQGIETPQKYQQRRQIFGPNVSQIKQKSTLSFLLDEVLHPFYIFQVFSIILWCTEDYYYYAFCIFLMSVWSTLTTLHTSKKNLKKISEMSKFTCPVVVYRKDQQGTTEPDYPYKHLDSSELVPGDILVIPPNELETLPCDAILLKGNCIVNESMLTGESMPVNKIPIKDDQLRSLDFEKDDIADMGNYCLFAGTHIIRVKGGLATANGDNYSESTLVAQAESDDTLTATSEAGNGLTAYQKKLSIYRKYESKAAYALVIRTGFNTAKGSLVRSMLFPKENFFKFYRDSFKFIFILSILAFFGFCGTIYYFIKYGVPFSVMITRALDMITVVVPPALPATMSIGTSFAISKLKKKNIFCISPNHVIVGGKLNLLCFDKTGTLTENGLCVQGVYFMTPTSAALNSQPNTDNNGIIQANANVHDNSTSHAVMTTTTAPLPTKSKVKFSSLTYPQSKKNQDFFSSVYSADIDRRENLTDSVAIRKRYMDLMKFGMATCHNLKEVDGHLIGDPLDIEMFKFVDWTLEESEGASEGLSTIVRPKKALKEESLADDDTIANVSLASKQFQELGILKVFEFASQLRRMSVVVRRMYTQHTQLGVANQLEVFVKGAPETIRDLSKSDTIPADFDIKLNRLVNKGFRVIALGYKTIDNVKFNVLNKMKREEVESDLEFLGFIIFENPLKEGTKKTIDTLNQASIRSVMCTGDNILTGISVARECDMIDKSTTVKILKFIDGFGEFNEFTPPEMIHGGRTPDAKIYLEEHRVLEDPSDASQTLHSSDSESDSETETEEDIAKKSPVKPEIYHRSESTLQKDLIIDVTTEVYAMTGDVFDWILYNFQDDQIQTIVENCKVFARMLPDQKKELVEKLQEYGYCVSFCGDGANDCGALKSSDVGLSLSEAEASVAAPLTSREMDLKCVLNVIREGRAALVTNFSCFKYMAIYSLIQFTTVSLLYSLAVNLGDFQYLFIDLFLIIPLAVAMGRSNAYHKIHPKAPSANLISFKVLVSLLGQMIIQMIFQFYIFIWSKRQPWYEAPEDTSDGETVYCVEDTVLFYVSCFQYIICALVFSVGPPYRQPITKNYLLILFSVAASALLVAMLFMPENWFIELMELMDIPSSGGKIHILIVVIVNMVVSALAELYLWNPIINFFRKKKNARAALRS